MNKGITHKEADGGGLKIGITVSRWNEKYTSKLLERCRKALLDSGVSEENINIIQVPGSYELPFAAKHLIESVQVDVVVCLGCLIKGSTMHFEYIAEAVSQGIMNLNLNSGTPVIFGVLTCLDEEQAEERVSEEGKDHGYEWGVSAVEMGLLCKSKV